MSDPTPDALRAALEALLAEIARYSVRQPLCDTNIFWYAAQARAALGAQPPQPKRVPKPMTSAQQIRHIEAGEALPLREPSPSAVRAATEVLRRHVRDEDEEDVDFTPLAQDILRAAYAAQ